MVTLERYGFRLDTGPAELGFRQPRLGGVHDLRGFLIPGIFILFGVGTLIGLGMAEFTPIWIGGSLGAFLGDVLSYWVGHRYRWHLREIWPFRRMPALLDRGDRFFRRHGAKSVLAGRFIGPLRPVIPTGSGYSAPMPSPLPACWG